jgi:hypothetical protein
VARGKRKILSRKKRSREEQEAEEVLAVARAADRAETGGRGSGILIRDSHTCVPLSDHVLGTEATEETPAQAEEPQEQEQQASPLRRSRRTTHSQTTLAAAPDRSRRGGRPAPRPCQSKVIHYDLRRAIARQIQSFRRVSIEEWFPLQRQPGVDYFFTALQEDFHMAYVNANVPVTAHRVIPLQSIVDLVGEEVCTYLQIVPSLTDLV